MKVRRFMGGTRCSVVALGVGDAGDYRGAERAGTLLERMGALREGMEWKDSFGRVVSAGGRMDVRRPCGREKNSLACLAWLPYIATVTGK